MTARFTGWLLGLERVASVDRVRPALGAEWATRGSGPFWLCLGMIAIIGVVITFYAKFQGRGSRRARGLLASGRIALLLLLLVTLAEPVLRISVSRFTLPGLFVVFDGTASMEMRDQYEPKQRSALAAMTGVEDLSSGVTATRSRQDYVRGWLARTASRAQPATLLARIEQAKACRLRVFLFDGQSDSHLRELASAEDTRDEIQWVQVSRQLSSSGQVTALGTVLRELRRQPGYRQLAGVLLISDFVQNSGEPPLADSSFAGQSPLTDLGVPVYAIGVGAGRSRDLAVQMQTEAKIRRGEKTTINVRLQQTELEGETVAIRVTARLPSSDTSEARATVVDTREVLLQADNPLVEIPYLPQLAGEVELRVEASVLPGEIVTDNNYAARRIQVIDDFIRLFYVADEPTWEWRFVKEVFHRDPAVGLRGFRTYLASSDPRVRETNPLFLPTLVQSPPEFFATDVLFLDDMPRNSLTPGFCSMVEQFVRDLGGGLVVLAGPRYGPQALLDTPLAKMLPVILDPHARLRDQREFKLELTTRREFSFMQLDDDQDASTRAWGNLDRLPWYQGVANKHERAIVLAQHPTDKCLDGVTPQPLIAIRRYGAGEVVYLGFNETWRLRRKYGEKYYRRFWLPLIDRLGLSHALGARKRFVLRMDRTQYRVEDEAIVSVQAYDENYERLAADAVDGESLQAEVVQMAERSESNQIEELRIGALSPGVFETRFPVLAEGTYRIRVKDPVAGSYAEQEFVVTGASAEMRSSVRDETLQERIADQSQGASCVLENADQLADRIALAPLRETEQHNYPLWNTPLWFGLVVSLMLGEWAIRKWINLV